MRNRRRHPRALTNLRRFLAQALLQPIGARVLGCLLQLSSQVDSARFWWQYAAGAGDYAATYCLYLHHRSLGEDLEANWWHTQTSTLTTRTPDPDDVDVATNLRVLRTLRSTGLHIPDPVHAVLDYVPVAVTTSTTTSIYPCP